MFFTLKLFLCFISLYPVVDSSVGIYPPEEKPEEYADQEGCYLSKLCRVLEYEVPYSPTDGSCVAYTCNRNNVTQVVGCGAIGIPKGYERAEGDKTLPYPECCDGIRKKDDE